MRICGLRSRSLSFSGNAGRDVKVEKSFHQSAGLPMRNAVKVSGRVSRAWLTK